MAEFVNFKYGLADIDLTEIHPSFAPQFYKCMTLETTEPFSEVTAKMHIKKTRQIVGHCITDEIITKNPLTDLNAAEETRMLYPLKWLKCRLYTIRKSLS